MTDIHEDREQFARDNIGLIYDFMNKFHIKYREDEIIDILYIGYTNALNTYSKELGEFSTYAFRCMKSAFSVHEHYLKRAMRIGDLNTVSLNTLVGEDKEDELLDFVEDPKVNVDKQVTQKMLIEYINEIALVILNDNQYRIFDLYYRKNMSITAIARDLNKTDTAIWQVKNKIDRKLKKCLAENFIPIPEMSSIEKDILKVMGGKNV